MRLIVLLCLIVRQVLGSSSEEYYFYSNEVYTENADIPNKPEFSLKSDSNRLVGENFQVNCSIPVKENVDYRNCSMVDDFSPTQNNCSIIHSDDTIIDINHLKIKHCKTGEYSSCKVVTTSVQPDNRTIVLYKNSLSVEDTGSYCCQYDNKRDTEDYFYLKVGYKPVGPRNITCISQDLNDLRCTWAHSKEDKTNPLPVWYTSYFFASPQYGMFKCPHPLPPNKSFRNDTGCSINPTTSEDNVTFSKYNSYTLYVSASNICESHVVEYNISAEEIVKFSAPIVGVISVQSRRIDLSINLTFNSQIALHLIERIQYRISYQSEHSSNTTTFTSAKDYNIIGLSNLTPFTKYIVTVRIKGVKAKYWSDPYKTFSTSKAAAPVAVPIIAGYSIYDGTLSLYLRPIRETEKNSADAFYNVTVLGELVKANILHVPWHKTTIENITTLQEHTDFLIKIRTVNNVGRSLDFSAIQIPHEKLKRQSPKNIVVEGSGRKYNVSWSSLTENSKILDNTVVYWCRGENMVCQNGLNWINISSNQTWLQIINETEGEEWIFAVSYKYTDGNMTEMVFSQCYFPSFTEAPTDVEKFSVVPISKTKIKVSPGDFCGKKYKSRPLLYTVFYKQSNEKVMSCDSNFQNKTVIADIETQDIILDKLKPSAKYFICLRVSTNGGWKMSPPEVIETFPDELKDKEKVYIIIVAVIFIVAGLGGITYFVCKMRTKYRNINIDIILPKINPRKYETVSAYDKDIQHEKSVSRSATDSGVSTNGISRSTSTIQNESYENMTTFREIDENAVSKEASLLTNTNRSNNHNRDITSEDHELKDDETNRTNDDGDLSARERSIGDGYSDFTLKSSKTSNSTKSSSQFSRPRCNRSSIKGIFTSNLSDKEKELEETSNDENIDKLNLHEENSSLQVLSKRNDIENWIRKSTENLNLGSINGLSKLSEENSADIEIEDTVTETKALLENILESDSFTGNSEEINTYVEVDNPESSNSDCENGNVISDYKEITYVEVDRKGSVISDVSSRKQTNSSIRSLESNSNSRILSETSQVDVDSNSSPLNEIDIAILSELPQPVSAEPKSLLSIDSSSLHNTSQTNHSLKETAKENVKILPAENKQLSTFQKNLKDTDSLIDENPGDVSSAISDYQKIGHTDQDSQTNSSVSDSFVETNSVSLLNSASSYTVLNSLGE